jgi:hypothetical protein
MKSIIETLNEFQSKPLNLEKYLSTYGSSRESLAYDVENETVLVCFDWRELRVNYEYEIKWHLSSIFDVTTGTIDGEEVQVQSYELSTQPYANSCTQSDSEYANLIRLNPAEAKRLILTETPFITLMDGMTIRPFGEYFTICHKTKPNKWHDALVSLNDLKFINFQPLKLAKSDKNIVDGLKTQTKSKPKSVSSSTKIIKSFLAKKTDGSTTEFFNWAQKLIDQQITEADNCEITNVKHNVSVSFVDANSKETTLSKKSLSSSLSRNRLK